MARMTGHSLAPSARDAGTPRCDQPCRSGVAKPWPHAKRTPWLGHDRHVRAPGCCRYGLHLDLHESAVRKVRRWVL